MEEEKIDYNAIPVYYCKHCLSLCIIGDDNMSFCNDCGLTDIGEASLEEYDNLYKEKYNKTLFLK